MCLWDCCHSVRTSTKLPPKTPWEKGRAPFPSQIYPKRKQLFILEKSKKLRLFFSFPEPRWEFRTHAANGNRPLGISAWPHRQRFTPQTEPPSPTALPWELQPGTRLHRPAPPQNPPLTLSRQLLAICE